MKGTIRHVHVAAGGNWSDVFVHETVRRRFPKHRSSYLGVMACASNLGCYGCAWDTAWPFAKVVKTMPQSAVLLRLSKLQMDFDATVKSVEIEIAAALERGEIDRRSAKKADAALRRSMDYSDNSQELLMDRLKRSRAFGEWISWHDIVVMDYPSQAKQFVDQLWPLIAEAIPLAPVLEAS